MEFLLTIVLIGIALWVLFLVLKPKTKPKSKTQKQEEIRLHYLQKLQTKLDVIDNLEERQKQKIALLKVFAKELEFNLFFDKEETQRLIKELAGY